MYESAKEKLSYIQGLLSVSDDMDEKMVTIIKALVSAVESQIEEIDELRSDIDELDQYVESIDSDLDEVEGMLDDFEDDFDEDDEDEHGLRLVKHDHHHCDCCHHDDDAECDENVEFDEDDDEDYLDGFDNLYLGAVCPECGRLLCVKDPDFDDPEALYLCPYCNKEVHISPIDPKNVPVAERVDK